jgi:hypothetical protein
MMPVPVCGPGLSRGGLAGVADCAEASVEVSATNSASAVAVTDRKRGVLSYRTLIGISRVTVVFEPAVDVAATRSTYEPGSTPSSLIGALKL